MILGTLALINMLFFGSMEYFLVDKLEKGVKTYVLEKERRKEILVDLSDAEKEIKAFNKLSISSKKQFKNLNLNKTASRAEFEKIFSDLHKKREGNQKEMIQTRLTILGKITQEEWDNIIAYSAKSTDSRLEKEAKKYKDPFAGIVKKINKSILNTEEAEEALTALEQLKEEFNGLSDKVKSMNSSESEVLRSKESTFEQLEKFGMEANQIREETFNALVDFHFNLKAITNESEWNKIMKEFNKIIN
jgi:hypothetical protein